MNNLVTTFDGFTVGETICNPDVGEFIIVAINAKKDRTLLLATDTNAFNRYIGAWQLQKKPQGDGYWWSQGHYFGGHLQAAMEYVLDIQPPEPKKDDIVIVVEDGMVTDVFCTSEHNVEIADLDYLDFDEKEALEDRVSEIRNSKDYKSIY